MQQVFVTLFHEGEYEVSLSRGITAGFVSLSRGITAGFVRLSRGITAGFFFIELFQTTISIGWL